MPSREEIREGIAEAHYYFDGWDGETKWEDVEDREVYYDCADAIMRKLHSQRCRIEVDRELPLTPEEYTKYADGMYGSTDAQVIAYQEAQQDMLKVGYVAVDPLIEKEVSNG